MAGGRERRSRERPSGSERDAQGDVRCLQADDGVAHAWRRSALNKPQDSDGSEFELAMEYSEVLAEIKGGRLERAILSCRRKPRIDDNVRGSRQQRCVSRVHADSIAAGARASHPGALYGVAQC